MKAVMHTDRATPLLLAAIVVLVGVLALRPAGVASVAQATAAAADPAQDQVAARQAAVEGARRAQMQVSAAPDGGLLVFDPADGEVFHVALGPDKAGVDWRVTIKRNEQGKWSVFPGGAEDVRADATRLTVAQADLTTIRAALEAFKLDNGRFPSTEEGLQSLVVQPPGTDNWKGPYLKQGVPKDPWGNPYVYRFPGRSDASAAELISFGPDRREAGGDDIAGK